MEKIDIILWAIGGGFLIVFGSLKMMWNEMTSRFDKLDEKVTDIDRRLCRLEGAFTSKEFCVLKNDRQSQRAE